MAFHLNDCEYIIKYDQIRPSEEGVSNVQGINGRERTVCCVKRSIWVLMRHFLQCLRLHLLLS